MCSAFWGKSFVTELTRISTQAETTSIRGELLATPALDETKLLNRYRAAKKRLFMFDYDGTLTPIVTDPQAAIPSDRVIRAIKKLAQDEQNSVWIVSGRDPAFLGMCIGHIPELGLSAEHGSFVRQPESDEWETLTENVDMAWQQEVKDVFEHYKNTTSGSSTEFKRVALTWHYRQADDLDHALRQARACKKQLEDSVAQTHEVEVMDGKANLEVRPRFVSKGEIVRRLLRAYDNGSDDDEEEKDEPGPSPPDFVLCSGDDLTDEDMFRALRASGLPADDVFSVAVGPSEKKTLAEWHLPEPGDVVGMIEMLNGDGEVDGDDEDGG